MQSQFEIHRNGGIIDECHILACRVALDGSCSKIYLLIFYPQTGQNGRGFDGHFDTLCSPHHNNSTSVDAARLTRDHLEDNLRNLFCCDAASFREGHDHILILFRNVDLEDGVDLREVLEMQFLLILLAD